MDGGTSGYSSAQAIDISKILNFIWSIIKTGQMSYTVVAAGVLVVLGFMLAFTGDNTGRKIGILSAMGAIVLGGVLIWVAPWLAGVLNTATQAAGQ